MGVRHLLRIVRAYAKLHAKTALEYRVTFFVQASFMFLNNLLYLFLFYLLFQTFGTINGYSFTDVALVQAIAMIAIGLVHSCFGGCRQIAAYVPAGKLDLFLSQPFSPLTHIGLSKSGQDGWGDVAMGIVIVAIFAPQRFVLALVCALAGAVAFTALEVAINSLAFLLARPKSLVRSARYSALALSSWPMDIYPSWVRSIVYGAGIAFVATVPRSVIVNFSWPAFSILIGVSFFMMFVAAGLFRLGLRRYESGNLISMRS